MQHVWRRGRWKSVTATARLSCWLSSCYCGVQKGLEECAKGSWNRGAVGNTGHIEWQQLSLTLKLYVVFIISLMGELLWQLCELWTCSRMIILEQKTKYQETNCIALFCTVGKSSGFFLQLALAFLFLLVLRICPFQSHSWISLSSQEFPSFLITMCLSAVQKKSNI